MRSSSSASSGSWTVEAGGAGASNGLPIALGALERSGSLSLATLDDEPAGATPTDGTLPASMGPATSRPPRTQQRPQPIDRFAPPEMAEAEQLLELADEDLAHRAQRRASTPPSAEVGRPSTSSPEEPGRPSTPSRSPDAAAGRWPASPLAEPVRGRPMPSQSPMASPPSSGQVPVAAVVGAPGGYSMAGAAAGHAATGRLGAAAPGAVVGHPSAGASGAAAAAVGHATGAGVVDGRSGLAAQYPWLASVRVRFAAGVVIAIVLGFVPANIVAGIRERSAFGAIDGVVLAAQAAADTPDRYSALDALRAEQLDVKRSARRMIMLTALAIWAATGGAVAYAWFRRVPWDRIGA